MTVLADAALDHRERDVREHFAAAIVRKYGADLNGVWLYGSRARGERSHNESDIDVLVVTGGPCNDDAMYAILHRILDELGNPRLLLEDQHRHHIRAARARRATRRPVGAVGWRSALDGD